MSTNTTPIKKFFCPFCKVDVEVDKVPIDKETVFYRCVHCDTQLGFFTRNPKVGKIESHIDEIKKSQKRWAKAESKFLFMKDYKTGEDEDE